MLRPIRNWLELRRALRAAKEELYICEECKHVWLGDTEPPLRCSKRGCRAWANAAQKYDSVGRPPVDK